MSTAAIYTRVGNPRRDDSHTLQHTRAVTVADGLGLEVVEHYADTGMSRGEFLVMLDQLRADAFEVIVVDRVTRLPKQIDALDRIADAGGRLVAEDGTDTGVPARLRYEAQVGQAVDVLFA